jgi:hypothetical protein
MLSNYRPPSGWNLASLTRDVAPFLAAALPVLKAHARIEHNLEDALLEQYLEAAFDAAEHYLDRDVVQSERVYLGNMGRGFVYRRGFVRSLKVTDLADVDVPIDPAWRFEYNHHERTPGLTIDLRCYCRCACLDFEAFPVQHKLLLAGGYESWARTPADVRQFVIAAASAMYEVREIANYAKVEEAAFLPLHLLASWANPSYA